MKFLIDAQLPRRLAHQLKTAGHDVLHTLDLPKGNRTPDGELITVAIRDERILVSKDSDFVNSFWIERQPPKLLLISTGNTTNKELESILLPQVSVLVEAFATHNFIELTRTRILIHE
jgi:predicted nuclease of predicted toxin-antitoxin system